ncbi:MAG: hypothetical protein ABL995_16925 [Bryobacteraceae bacterium]
MPKKNQPQTEKPPEVVGPSRLNVASEVALVPPNNAPPFVGGTVGDVHLIYKIEGRSQEVPVFELAKTLEAVGNVIHEANRIMNPQPHSVVVKVRPFEEGSFWMDLVLSVQNNPTILFALSHPEAIEHLKKVLEYVGLIKKSQEVIATVKDVIEFLKGEKPAKTERQPDGSVTYTGNNGKQLNVLGTVNNLYVNPVINNNYYYAFGGNGMNREEVHGLSTFLRGQEDQTKQFVPKEEVISSLKSYSEPSPLPAKTETITNDTIQFLNPKEGTYGSAEGVTFLPAGKKRGGFKAKITDPVFLSRFHSGQVRFYQNDILKARVKTEQTLKNGKASAKHEIVEVLNYAPAPIR